jgi:hypothetical protein
VEVRCSPSEDSMRARSVATDGIRTSGGRSEYGGRSYFRFLFAYRWILLRGT